MQIVRQLQELNEALSTESNRSIGFVPTMGFLHRGHLSLINESQKKADFTIVSIFVNPTQFNNPTDLKNYPVSLKEDLMTLEHHEVDLVFCPDYDALYKNEKPIKLALGTLDSVLEGTRRKGHFQGVVRVVNIFFKLINPNYAFFGEKDYQQLAVIRQMVRDLDVPVDIISHPTVREHDGLALSSRNSYLTADQRVLAPQLYATLCDVAGNILDGNDPLSLIKTATANLLDAGFDSIDYFELRDGNSLAPVQTHNPEHRLLIAAALGETRLIDNIALGRYA